MAQVTCKTSNSLQLCGCKWQRAVLMGITSSFSVGCHSQIAPMGGPWEQCASGYSQGFCVRGIEPSKVHCQKDTIFSSPCSHSVHSYLVHWFDPVATGLQCTTSLCHSTKWFVPRLFLEWHATQNGLLPQRIQPSNLPAASSLWLENLLKGLFSH